MSESKEREGAEGGVEGGEMAGGAEAAEEELPEAHVQEEEMVGVAVQQEGDKLPPFRDDVVEEASPSDEGNSPISPHENADVELAPPTGGDGEVVEVMSGNAVEVKGEVGEKVNLGNEGGDVKMDDASGGPSKEKAIGELEHGGSSKEHHQSQEAAKPTFDFNTHSEDGSESGSEEEQAAFMKELANFFRERALDFKPPKFYGEGLNCLKLWRAVIRLGGYDQVTYCKLWRQVGESFKPPKTCTTVSWTFRGFYEKALLDYERHKVRNGEIIVAASPLSEPLGAQNQVSGSKTPVSGRARRDAAARAMQGWHSQRLLGNGEVGDPIIKDKSTAALAKREKQLKNLSSLKRKKPSPVDRGVKVARPKVAHPRDGQSGSPVARSETSVVDIGPAADWVKINVQRTRDCFEIYALVPGLLREEVRVQSDPAGRLVISGEPEQPDNPWGVTPFKKVVSLPSRIDPHQTSAVVTLHGQLFVRAPFEQSA